MPYVDARGVGSAQAQGARYRGSIWPGRSRRSAEDVTQFRPGDEVFGWCAGAFAEYAVPRRTTSLPKPANLTFEQAAAVADAAFTALQALRDDGQVQPGQKVLINGASGGVGTFAVQIAKSFGAEVTGVCSTRNVDLVRSIGADHVIDYTQEDFTQTRAALRPDARQRGEPFAVCVPARADPQGDLRRRPSAQPEHRWLGPLAQLLRTFVLSPSSARR